MINKMMFCLCYSKEYNIDCGELTNKEISYAF